MTDRERLLACRTEEEWQRWIETEMLHFDLGKCLFCRAFADDCEKCEGKCWQYKLFSDRYFAGWDRLRRAGIV
jgi:hypothetical protein